MYQCDYCNYESVSKFNVGRHEAKKHKLHRPWETSVPTSQIKTSYVQGYPQLQPVQHGQVVHQQPPHHGE